MDGVLIRDGEMIEGADHFLRHLSERGRPYFVVSNNSLFTTRQLSKDLANMGLEVPEVRLWTSAIATAEFVSHQRPNGTAFVIGEESVHEALASVGYREDVTRPDYVVLGETWQYSYEDFATAIRLVNAGSHFVSTNPEPTGPTPEGSLPGCGSMAAVIESATGVSPYVVGKPNSMMIRSAMVRLGAKNESTAIVGDRMDTDVRAGIDAGIRTILVLSGVHDALDAQRYPYTPWRVADSLAQLAEEI